MGLKKSFFLLSFWCILTSLLFALLVFFICNVIITGYPSGGVELDANGVVTPLAHPTPEQQRAITVLTCIQWFSCIIFPVSGLGIASALFYHIKLKVPISVLQTSTKHILEHELDFSIPNVSSDELGQICSAFETMRIELLKTNHELWQQAEERKRLNAAFSHDLRNPITVLKGTIKMLRQGIADNQALDRLESYTLRIEQYIEAMSSIQRLEQMPIRTSECTYSLLRTELSDTANLLASALNLSISSPDKGTVCLDHGLFLNVAENLISNAARFAKNKLEIRLVCHYDYLSLSVIDDGPGYPAELVQKGPKPFGKLNEDASHFGLGLYNSEILCQKHGGTLKLENVNGQGAMAVAFFQINHKS